MIKKGVSYDLKDVDLSKIEIIKKILEFYYNSYIKDFQESFNKYIEGIEKIRKKIHELDYKTVEIKEEV